MKISMQFLAKIMGLIFLSYPVEREKSVDFRAVRGAKKFENLFFRGWCRKIGDVNSSLEKQSWSIPLQKRENLRE